MPLYCGLRGKLKATPTVLRVLKQPQTPYVCRAASSAKTTRLTKESCGRSFETRHRLGKVTWVCPKHGLGFLSTGLARSSSRQVRIRVPFFSAVYFNRRTLSKKKGEQGHYWGPSWPRRQTLKMAGFPLTPLNQPQEGDPPNTHTHTNLSIRTQLAPRKNVGWHEASSFQSWRARETALEARAVFPTSHQLT